MPLRKRRRRIGRDKAVREARGALYGMGADINKRGKAASHYDAARLGREGRVAANVAASSDRMRSSKGKRMKSSGRR